MISIEQALQIMATVLTISGLLMIFKYGISPNINKDGRTFFYNEEDFNDKIKARKEYEKKAVDGLYISIIGQILQLVAVFI